MMKHTYPKLSAFLARICELFTPSTLGLFAKFHEVPSWRFGFNGHLPCNKRQQRKAKALRAKRRARRLGHA